MTVCNMSVEAGAKAGFIAADEKTYLLSGKTAPNPPREKIGTRRCATGKRCNLTTARISIARSGSTRQSCRRSSPGARAPNRVVSIAGRVPRLDEASPTSASARRSNGRWPTWDCSGGEKICRHRRSTASSSAPAPMAASKICAPPPRSVDGKTSGRQASTPWSCRAQAAGQRTGRVRRARQGLPRSRLRMARARLLACAWP